MAQTPRLNPLNQTHLDAINRVLELTPPAIELAEVCIECGLPADEYRDQLKLQQDQARKIKAKFFPAEP